MSQVPATEKPFAAHNGATAGGYEDGQPLAATLTASQPGFPVYHRKYGNPAPLGLFSFASTTLILSLYNVHARHVTVPNVVVGMALAVGGLGAILAGMWEFPAGNTFAATAFTSYGGFFLSYAALYLPWTGIIEAYIPVAYEIPNAVGIYLITWFVFTFIMFLATHKTSLALATMFFFLTITFILLSAAEFTNNAKLTKAGGAFGIVSALCAYYIGAASLYTTETSYIRLPVVSLARNA